ncbi:hypothetical protein ACOAKG_42150 [Streptomyces sp. JL3001]|uniref:hypothetical protein n=1 Tax=Streptomyces sp. JL3001 TaxID=3400923 RepID=UPI003B28C2A4
MTPLTYSTLVQDGIQRAGGQRMPSGDPLVSSPLTSTLIMGDATATTGSAPATCCGASPPLRPGRRVPDLGLVVAGDAVYNNVHLYLSEGANGGFAAWLRALDTVEGLRPVAVVAGHQDRSRPDTPDTIAQTRAYLDDVEHLLARHPTPTAFYQEMLVRHPDRLNPSPLWYGAQTLLG